MIITKKERYLKTAIKASLDAGKVLMENYSTNNKIIRRKNFRDVSSRVDYISENKILNTIKKEIKNQSILFEENGLVGSNKKNYWVIDALDGTVNYLNKIPIFATSIAYVEKKKIILGCIFNPATNELYYSCFKDKVYKNSLKLNLPQNEFKDGLYAMSFSGDIKTKKIRDKEAKLFIEINDMSRGCLRTGALTINLGYFCEGKISGCIGHRAKLWDAAAGIGLAENLGAKVLWKLVGKNLINFIVGNNNNFNKIKKIYEKNLGKF